MVAHSMSVIAVQAGVGAHVLDEHPQQARAALEAISATSRGTLTEMRRLLGVLRDSDGARSHAPAPGLADLPQLVHDVQSVGVPVTLHLEGQSDCINSGIELSAYRVVQEALTNVIKHAGSPTRVDVTVQHAPGVLTIEVKDDGRGAASIMSTNGVAPGGTGHGLIGMRERVELWGGELAVGPASGGGYRVRASLPYGDVRMTIRVVVADDQALVRKAFVVLLSSESDIEVVGEAANGAEAVALAASERPDLMLMDVRMPVMDGLEATRRITGDESLSATRVVILTTFDLDEYVHEALRAGASGFLLKDTLPVDLINAVRVVAAGDALIAPAITRRLIAEFARLPEPGAAHGRCGARPADRPRAGSARARRQGPIERRDRGRPLREPGHRQDPHEPAVDEARRPRSSPARDARLRDRPGVARRQLIVTRSSSDGRAALAYRDRVPASERFDAAYYRRYYGRHPVHDRRRIGQLAAGVLALAQWWRIPIRSALDIGAGKGFWRDGLAAAAPHVRYHGIDVSEHACRRYGHEQADLATWWPHRRYDLVVCQSVIQYLDDRRATEAIDALAAATRGLLFLEIPTTADRDHAIDPAGTDLDVHWRTGTWYRKRLRLGFTEVGGGLWLSGASDAVLFELERAR